MQIGVVFPQTEMPADTGAVRAYVDGVAEAGFAHILVYDHVVGADPNVHTGWRGPYDVNTPFLEPFVLYGFVAAISSLELATGIIILPQRQTVLAAKQAATLDVLCRGRFRMGVGIGWNAVEYEALGEDFHTRGRRLEEQVELMRRLWTEPSVSFTGRYHKVTGAGIAPLPVQRPIPVWMGARADRRGLERVGRMADGWIPLTEPGPELDTALAVIQKAAADAGRDSASIGVEGRMDVTHGDPSRIQASAEAWQQAGATHLSLNTMRGGLEGVEAHLSVLKAAADVLGVRA
jgi:probable F420-dependent oxidoreductase